VGLLPVLHEKADDPVALLFEQKGRDRGVDPPRHAHDDGFRHGREGGYGRVLSSAEVFIGGGGVPVERGLPDAGELLSIFCGFPFLCGIRISSLGKTKELGMSCLLLAEPDDRSFPPPSLRWSNFPGGGALGSGTGVGSDSSSGGST